MRNKARVRRLEQARAGGEVSIRVCLSYGDTLREHTTAGEVRTWTREQWEEQARERGACVILVRAGDTH